MSKRENNPDWKIFRAMAPELRERYLQARNKELMAILADEQSSPTERFWEVHDQTRKIARILQHCLDGHARSSMDSYILLMLNRGMMTMHDLSSFSEELRTRMLLALPPSFGKTTPGAL
jgi:hypothetical protein